MSTELQLDQMTIEEKPQLVDRLWLSLTPELEEFHVPLRDRELLDRRWVEFPGDRSVFLRQSITQWKRMLFW